MKSDFPTPDSIISAYGNEKYTRRSMDGIPAKYSAKIDEIKWKHFKHLNGDAILLVPPRRLAASDISHFAKKHGIDEWNELWVEIQKVWQLLGKGYWISSHGALPYLHTRFEKRTHVLIGNKKMQVRCPDGAISGTAIQVQLSTAPV